MVMINDARELATVLAALRLWQRGSCGTTGIQAQILEAAHGELDIASDGESLVPLTAEEIDELCERLNTQQDIPTVVLSVEGAAIHAVASNLPARCIILDSDVEGSDWSGVTKIDGKDTQVIDVGMGGHAVPGGWSGRIDPAYVSGIAAQIDK